MYKRNPKQEGSNLFDCKPQLGPCKMNCNQCFYNRSGAFYIPIDEAIIPSIDEVGNGIVRMNCGYDSNIQRDEVVLAASLYKNVFFNTSIPKFGFPGPVVFTANPKEEMECWMPEELGLSAKDHKSIMFVRLRVSASNLKIIEIAIKEWANEYGIPVVLTFMAYYEEEIFMKMTDTAMIKDADLLARFSRGTNMMCREMLYQFKIRHINSYWCPTKEFMQYVLDRMSSVNRRLVTMCGTPDSYWCRDCRNCETYYWQTVKRMKELQ